MSLIHYLLEANLYLAAFYLLYYLFLSKETHYQLNRAYLLGTTFLAFIIPLVQIGRLIPSAASSQNTGVTIITLTDVDNTPMNGTETHWPLINYILLAYGIIALLLLSNFLLKIYQLIRLSRLNKTEEYGSFKLVEVADENNAFSFFNYLFISPGLSLSSTVINHELIHIRQKHSWDIIYIELLKIINWFNPFVYLLQNSVKEVHEFIADSHTVNNEPNTGVYTDFLVNNAYGINENTLTNTFFNKSLLKKRIMMLHQKKSGNAARLKYLLILPLTGGLLCASTLAFAKTYGWIDLAPKAKTLKLKPDTTKAANVKKTVRLSMDRKMDSMKTQINVDVKQEVALSKAKTIKLRKSPKGSPSKDLVLITDTTRIPPPPPPAAPADIKPPTKIQLKNLPSAAPADIKAPAKIQLKNPPPPPPPAEVLLNDKGKGKVKFNKKPAHATLYLPAQKTEKIAPPLILVNGEKYTLKNDLKHGQYLYFIASDSTIQHSPGEMSAMRKWGDEAKNGVVELYGKTSVSIK